MKFRVASMTKQKVRFVTAMVLCLMLILVLRTSLSYATTHWDYSETFDENFVIYWNFNEDTITFEIHAATLGWVGLGFSYDGGIVDADLVIIQVKDGRVTIQDRYTGIRGEPQLDYNQDYDLLLGYENETHTVVRFSRKYDTCDVQDYIISNDTMRILYVYGSHDMEDIYGLLPRQGSVSGFRTMYLLQSLKASQATMDGVRSFDVRNPWVSIPAKGETLFWCKISRLPTSITKKQHIFKWEALYQSGHEIYVHHMVVYECLGKQNDLYMLSGHKGFKCDELGLRKMSFNCSTVVASIAPGSKGFRYPPDVGYPLDPGTTNFVMLETHYYNTEDNTDMTDSTGVRIWYTASLRPHDAGILTLGVKAGWRHLIPPGQPLVISEGHCITDCTDAAIPANGVNFYALAMHTHDLGRKIRLRILRNGVEEPPVAMDNNLDISFQGYRVLKSPIKLLPGDHLITECTYNSEQRHSITLGGSKLYEEICIIYGMYYPRMDLARCQSLPSLSTVLLSLGINELWMDRSPIMIKSPVEIANMSLEQRLVYFNWEDNFNMFQDITKRGSFEPECVIKKFHQIQTFTYQDSFIPEITQSYIEPNKCLPEWKRRHKKIPDDPTSEGPVLDEDWVKGIQLTAINAQVPERLNSSQRIGALFLVVASSTLLLLI